MKSLITLEIVEGIQKSSKNKQKLYIRYLKSRTFVNETKYKNYKNLFERIKNASKKQHFTFLLKKYQNDAKKYLENYKGSNRQNKIEE